MNEHTLEFILKMRDEASKKIEQFSQKIQNEMDKAGDSLIKFGQQLNKVGKDLTMIGAAITAPLALAFKTTADNSLEAHEALKRLGDSAREFQVTVGTALTPVVEKISYLFAGLTQWFENMDPKMRDTILQGALMTGIFFTLGGALMHVIGKMSDLIGRIFQFASAHPILMAITIALTLMIANWEKVREVAIPIMNALEIGAKMVAIGFQTLVKYMADSLANVTSGLETVLYYLSMIPGPQQKVFEAMRDSARGTKDFFQSVSEAARLTIADLENSITQILETGQGDTSTFVDNTVAKIQELYSFISNPPKMNVNTADIDAESVVVAEQKKVDQLRNIWTAWTNEKTTMEMARLQSETEFYNVAIDAQTKAHQSMWTVIGQAKDTFAAGVSKLFVDMAKGTADVKKFFQDLGWQMVEILINFAVQKAINWVLAQAMLSAEIAASYGAAAAIAAAWAPAAAMASLATFGANSGPAAAAIAGTTAFAYALSIPAMAKGGIVDRPTVALIGEAGPEAVIPLGRGQGSAGQSLNIHIYGPVVRDEQDIDALANEISRRIARGTAR